jgi:hypothetical protein
LKEFAELILLDPLFPASWIIAASLSIFGFLYGMSVNLQSVVSNKTCTAKEKKWEKGRKCGTNCATTWK